MPRPRGTIVWPPIPKNTLWKWYWEDLLSPTEIAKKWGDQKSKLLKGGREDHPCSKWVVKQMKLNRIPLRSASDRSKLWQANKPSTEKHYKASGTGRLHKQVYEEHYGPLPKGYEIHHKDYTRHNNHPLNLEPITTAEHARLHFKTRKGWNKSSIPPRIPIFEVYLRMAEQISARSHHKLCKVGCVVVSGDLRRVLSVGFNGNAKGLSNEPDCDIPGESQTIHAEENALLFAGEHGTDRIMFSTHSPCLMCVKRMINAGIKYLYFRNNYRDSHPLKVAAYSGIQVCHYIKWKNTKW